VLSAGHYIRPCRTSQGDKFLETERGGNRDGPIVKREWAPSEDPSRHRKKTVRQRVTLQIQQQYCASCEVTQTPNHFDDLAIGKMMQHRRAENEVEGLLPEWQVKRIRYDSR
jgi:hypothetical protein